MVVAVPDMTQVELLILAHAGSVGATVQFEIVPPFELIAVGLIEIGEPTWPTLFKFAPLKLMVGDERLITKKVEAEFTPAGFIARTLK